MPSQPPTLMLTNAAEVASEIHVGLTSDVRGGLQRLAELLGQPYTTVYSNLVRVEAGEQEGLPMDLVRAAHFLLGPRLDHYLLWPGQRVIPDAGPLALGPGGPTPAQAEHLCGDVCIDAANQLAELRVALADGRLAKVEARRLRQGIRQIHEDAHQVSLLLDAFLAKGKAGGSAKQP